MGGVWRRLLDACGAGRSGAGTAGRGASLLSLAKQGRRGSRERALRARERGRRRWERPNEEGIGQEMEIGPLLAALVGRRGKGVGSERLGLGLGEVALEAGLGAGDPGGPARKIA